MSLNPRHNKGKTQKCATRMGQPLKKLLLKKKSKDFFEKFYFEKHFFENSI